MKPRVYIETSVVSYLVAAPGRDLIIAAHQQITREWWTQRRSAFELFASQLVVDEAGRGDPRFAQSRLTELSTIPLLVLTEDAKTLARDLFVGGPLPEKAAADAFHVALAAVSRMDYLLTWNCRHLANAQMQRAIASKCESLGYDPPVICTPEELMGK